MEYTSNLENEIWNMAEELDENDDCESVIDFLNSKDQLIEKQSLLLYQSNVKRRVFPYLKSPQTVLYETGLTKINAPKKAMTPENLCLHWRLH